jgi:hypothetical protein
MRRDACGARARARRTLDGTVSSDGPFVRWAGVVRQLGLVGRLRSSGARVRQEDSSRSCGPSSRVRARSCMIMHSSELTIQFPILISTSN